MQFDLLSSPSGDETIKAVASEQDEVANEENLGTRFAKLFADYKAALEAWSSDLVRLQQTERVILPAEHYVLAIKQVDVEHTLREVARDIFGRMVRAAEEQFAPAGGQLKIDACDLREKFPIAKGEAEGFDPKALWDHLEQTYGGVSGKELAWHQEAAKLVSAFWIRRSDEVVRKGGFVVLSRSVYVDKHDKEYGRIKLSYSSQQTIGECCNALASFAAWAEKPVLERDMPKLRDHFCWYDHRVESRKQFVCGEGELVLVTFQTSFEFRIREDLATLLNLYIGTYAADKLGD